MPSAIDSGINAVNSIKNVSEAQYTEIWQKLFATMLYGFWGRFFFLAFLALGLFYGVRRRNPRAAIVFILIAVSVAFGGWFMKVTNLM